MKRGMKRRAGAAFALCGALGGAGAEDRPPADVNQVRLEADPWGIEIRMRSFNEPGPLPSVQIRCSSPPLVRLSVGAALSGQGEMVVERPGEGGRIALPGRREGKEMVARVVDGRAVRPVADLLLRRATLAYSRRGASGWFNAQGDEEHARWRARARECLFRAATGR